MDASPLILVTCPSCAKASRLHQSKIRSGLSHPCPQCGKDIPFDGESPDLNIKKALNAARKFRLTAANPTAKPTIKF
jgi:endogenous inhibitor of DNA gyrase (YacG/DUF329 family)